MISFNKNKKLLLILFFCFFVVSFNFLEASESDSIGLRVLPNIDHFPVEMWYQKQGFSGAPQTIVIDGYQAVKSGGTIYVNIGNAVSTDGDDVPDAIHTNIYVISVTEGSDENTIKIFEQIVNNWKFNNNVDNVGLCQFHIDHSCETDIDCPSGDYCNSEKAILMRDTIRMEDAVLLTVKLEEYKIKNGRYPTLNSGSYVKSATLSSWPSWQSVLGKEMKIELPIDPVNKMGACPGFSEKTCWNSENQLFATNISSGVLPAGTNAYMYLTNENGDYYNICVSSESLLYNNIPGGCINKGEYSNHQPEFISENLQTVFSGSEFKGYIQVDDIDDDIIDWEISSVSDWSSWSSMVEIRETGTPYIKEIYAESAGSNGNYYFTINIDDQEGEVNSINSKSFFIYAFNPPPDLNVYDITYTPNMVSPFEFVFSAIDPNHNHPIDFVLIPSALPASLLPDIYQDGDVFYFRVNSFLPDDYYLPVNETSSFTLRATDSFFESTEETFLITLENQPPEITNFSCLNSFRVGEDLICSIEAFDPDGHSISYSIISSAGTPTIDNSGNVNISNINSFGSYSFEITITDQHGASVSQYHGFTANTFCGNGNVEMPNMEGGAEQCDDGNTNDIDACTNDCQWTMRGFDNAGNDNDDYSAVNVVFDNNNNQFSAIDTGGEYFKVSQTTETPYLWVANSYTCPAATCDFSVTSGYSLYNRISKIRTFDGLQRTSSGFTSVVENAGDFLGSFLIGGVGSNPSRTAVNAETGDVWVANRSTGDVSKLNIDGILMKTCITNVGGDRSGAPRGVAIEENGDVWVGNYMPNISGVLNLVKFSGNDSDCTILENINIGHRTYGMSFDSKENIWINTQRPESKLIKFDINTFSVEEFDYPETNPLCYEDPVGTPVFAPYGIAVDINDDVWVTDVCEGVLKFDTDNSSFYYQSFVPFSSTARTIGVTADTLGGVWIAAPLTDEVIHIPDVNSPGIFSRISSNNGATTGDYPRGIAGDSEGNVWSINLYGNSAITHPGSNVSLYSYLGFNMGIFPVNPSIPPSDVVVAYTYSDMSGVNRAMLFRTGDLIFEFDSGYGDQHWGSVTWDELIPGPKQSVEIQMQASNSSSALGTAYLGSTAWNSLSSSSSQRAGRYLQIFIRLRSREQGVTPVISNLRVNGDLML